MPRAVDGTYETPSNSVAPAVASTTIDPDDFNTLVTDIETAVSDTVYTAGLGATDNKLIRTDGTNAKKAQGSPIGVDDSGNLSGIGTLGTSGVATIGTTAATAVRIDPAGFLLLPEITSPATPASGFTAVYVKTDGKTYQKTDGGTETDLSAAGGGGSTTAPTRQTFTSGSGTYTTPASVVWLRVRMVGGGGGGGGSGTSPGNGGAGGNTTFSTFTASGSGGASGLGGGSGGTATGGTINTTGGRGADAANSSSVGSGYGGSSLMGPGAGPAVYGGSVGRSATANTGGGGSGATATTGVVAAAGGGAGGYVEGYIAAPSASYSYAIGAGGTAGAAGTSGSAGGVGGSGYIIVEEFY